MRNDETDQPPASDMAPMSGHTHFPDNVRTKAAHLPLEADEDDQESGALKETQPTMSPTPESSSQ